MITKVEYDIQYNKVNKDKINERRRQRYAENPDKYRSQMYKHRYGVELEEYDRMFAEQDGVCAICKQASSDTRRLAIDHNHTTGAVRGLLCIKCNSMIAQMESGDAIIDSAISYLRKQWDNE